MFKKIVLIMILTVSSAWAKMVVSFDPEEVHLNESTELTIESQQAFKEAPDLTALTGNFDVGGQKSGDFLRQINGRKVRFYRYVYNLHPRKTGRLSSDGITIRDQLLPVAELNVLEPVNRTDLPIQIQASVVGDKFFPNEAFYYTLKLTDGADLMSGQMTPPFAENASIQLLDSLDRVYQEYIGDKQVRITERTYAITPLAEGPLTIPPVIIYGKILTEKKSWQEIRLVSDPITVTVLPKPVDWKGWWLPATQVSLDVEDNFPETIQVGSSLNRRIILKANGIMADYLPKILQPQGDKVRIYPSPEERRSVPTTLDDVQGIEIMSLVLVPEQGGEVKIPSVQIPWFNTKTLKREIAFIPERMIQVQGQAEPVPAQIEEKQIPMTDKIQQKTEKQKPLVPKKDPVRENPSQRTNVFPFLVIGISILIGIMIIFRFKKHKTYLLPQQQEKVLKKKKKPLADLYPF